MNAPPQQRAPDAPRIAVVAVGVLALHAVALWALSQGLLRPLTAIAVPPVLIELIAVSAPAPAPVPAPPPAPRVQPAPHPPAQPAARRAPPRPAPALAPAPPPPVAQNITSSAAPGITSAPAPASDAAPSAAPATVAPTPIGPAAPVATLSPSSEAYLHNPKPPYPVMSRRLGESGNVIVRALFGPDGRVLEARLQRSSGFERLDRSALETVRNDWRYSMPEWRDIPVSFSLKQPGEQ